MLLLAGAAMLMPAISSWSRARVFRLPAAISSTTTPRSSSSSLAVAIVLMLSYGAGLLFSLKTHRDLFNPPHDDFDEDSPPWSVRKSVIVLAIAGVAVGVMSEILVGSISEASDSIGAE